MWAVATAARASADVGLIRLAVMGENLALSMADHGYRLTVCNRTTAVMAPSSRLPHTPRIGIVVLVVTIDTHREPPGEPRYARLDECYPPTAAAVVLRAS